MNHFSNTPNAGSIGYVYILTNPSFKKDWVTIGKSSRPVDVRSKELDNTAVPLLLRFLDGVILVFDH